MTTVDAILQRVPPPAGFKGSAGAKRGGRLDQGKLVDFLVGNGYARSGTVREPGEYAVRGGIVDLFPPGTTSRCASISSATRSRTCGCSTRCRSAASARSTNSPLRPINEVQLTPEAIERFRTGYRSEFGTSGADDPLYEAVSAGRQFPAWSTGCRCSAPSWRRSTPTCRAPSSRSTTRSTRR